MRDITYQRQGPPARGSVRRIARRIAAVVAECNDAQRRMLALFLAPDRYARDHDRAPDSYGEFLFRTSGLLQREPAARDRSGC